jgi:type I restriction enzyme S subunit
MAEFPNIPIGEVATVRSGYAFKSSDWKDFGTPVVKIANVKSGRLNMEGCSFVDDNVARAAHEFQLMRGDILIAMTGYIGEVAVVREADLPALLNQRVGRFSIRDERKLDRRFLYYAVTTPSIRQEIEGLGYGSAQPNVSPSLIQSVQILLPPIACQQAIASVLSALDDKIELNRRMNETLEAMAQAIFKDWFVDFGPTCAKMEGRAPYLAPDIWSLFPDRLDEEGKPEGWDFGTLGDVAEQVGESVQPEALDPGTPYVGLEHMPRKSIALSEWEGAGKVTSGKLTFRKGDFLFGKLRPYFHKVGIAPLDGICSTDIVVLNARERKAAAFVLACISQDEFVAFTDRTSDGTKMPRTSWGRMERYRLCLPSESALEAFNACVEPLLDRIMSNIHESRALAVTRDFLLPKLMSGEVRVEDAAKHIGKAT